MTKDELKDLLVDAGLINDDYTSNTKSTIDNIDITRKDGTKSRVTVWKTSNGEITEITERDRLW